MRATQTSRGTEGAGNPQGKAQGGIADGKIMNQTPPSTSGGNPPAPPKGRSVTGQGPRSTEGC